MHVIEQPLPPAPEAGAEPNIVAQWTALYDAHTEIACLMLGSMTPELHRQFELHYPYDMIQELRSMFENKLSGEMKGYVEQLERLGYMLPQDISVGLILNGLTKDFVGFVRNYNMHNMGKTIGEIHAMLIEYEKGLPKKAETPQVMMIKSGKIQKANKKSLNAKGKNKGNGKGKDKKVYIPKPNNPKSLCLRAPKAKDDACHHCKEVGHWKRNCPVYLAELQKKRKQVGSASSSDMVRSMMNLTTLPLSFWDYALESATRILNMVPTKKVDKTPYELCGSAVDLGEIQEEEDTTPSEITINILKRWRVVEPPQRSRFDPVGPKDTSSSKRLCLNVEV
ncbi:retrotransposon protein, putative, ty1-copia subclass [Tanacetum coccineum]